MAPCFSKGLSTGKHFTSPPTVNPWYLTPTQCHWPLSVLKMPSGRPERLFLVWLIVIHYHTWVLYEYIHKIYYQILNGFLRKCHEAMTKSKENCVCDTYLIRKGINGDIFWKFLITKENSPLDRKYILCEVWTNHPRYTNITKIASISYYTINSCKIKMCIIYVSIY